TELDRHLSRMRPGNEIDRRHHVEKVLAVEPFSPVDDLFLHQRQVRRRSAEGREAQTQKKPRDLCKSRRLLFLVLRSVGHGWRKLSAARHCPSSVARRFTAL